MKPGTADPPTCWIDTVSYADAEAPLRATYDQVRGPSGTLDNLYQAFSLRPHTIEPADALYRAALHHDDNSLPKRFAELIGSYVAVLTGCDYALAHHGRNFASLHGDPEQAEAILGRLGENDLASCGDAREIAALHFTRKLCVSPEQMRNSDVEALTQQGWDDGEVLEIVQVVAMFSYFVRVINAVGISLKGERIGFY